MAKRRCRDCFWAVLFILFWVGQLIIGIYASQVGNAESLIYGVDYEGNLCGVKNPTRDLTNYPYLFYFEAVSDANYSTPPDPTRPRRLLIHVFSPSFFYFNKQP